MQVALLGLSQSGKSCLFSAVTEGHVHSDAGLAHHADKAIVKVPDHRLEVLTEVYKPKKTIFATIEFLDLPGLNFIEEATRQDARRIIAQARQAAMLVLVVRCFENSSVARYRGRIDPAADLDEIRTEMFLTDLESVANRIGRLEKSITKPTKTQQQDKHELELMRAYSEKLENMQALSEIIKSPEEEKFMRSFGFLTMKPVLVVLNVNDNKLSAPVAITPDQAGDDILTLSAQMEAEIAALDEDDRGIFLEDMGLTEIARDRLVKSCYHAMNLVSFLTVGDDEVRAWTIPKDCPAVEAAGQVHSDIQRGFIRAETIAYDDFIAFEKDMKAAKAAGKVRLEGKQYPVHDGDIINFRFNV
ncbi:MAG: redox-regulated ATPase YchF [Sedimentisphaerales bacterium]|nr:redox-regulated ATPase YchF [Sedimentisphaerales bacterium]